MCLSIFTFCFEVRDEIVLIMIVPKPKAKHNITYDYVYKSEYPLIWENFPNSERSKMNLTNVTIEEPCDYKENNFERYYPIKDLTGKSQTIYNKYLK